MRGPSEKGPHMPKIDETRPFIPVGIAVLTVSDTRSLADDRSGDALVQMLESAGHRLAARALVKDDVPEIRAKVQTWIAEAAVDVVITTGGTGFTGRDVTPEAVRPLFEKEVDGFSTVFHMVSFQKVGTSTIQSRACAGLARGTYIFCLPGSPGACKDAWNEILKWQLDNRHRPCNFVEIMPRLEEHRRKG
jgi:molybdopterin adenylyltransferase